MPPGEWTVDIRATAQVVAACVMVALLVAFLHRASGEAKWSQVPGTIQDTRIVADHTLQTKWGSQVIWRAEYKVLYTVGNREYAVWADSGVRGESEGEVRLNLPHTHPACRVKHSSEKPESSVADCL
jgi:hypothetical protein